jgi:aldehyde:ferredoxin oxidoreductase
MLCTLERALAVRDGRTRQDDIFHDLYFEQQDAAGRRYRREDLEESKTGYYKLMGWDSETGKPTIAALQRLGLKDVAAEMVQRGLLRS